MSVQLNLGFANYYDRFADKYLERKKAGLLYFNDAIEVPATMQILGSRLGRLKGVRALDVGSGLGTYSSLLAAQGCQVTAIDISPKMVEITHNVCANQSVEVHCVDFLQFSPKKRYSYNVIVAGFMLGYFIDLDSVFRKFQELSAKGGVVLVSSVHPAKKPYAQEAGRASDCSYFGREYHGSDFLDEDEPLKLRRWLPDEVTEAAYRAKLSIDQILEPRPAFTPRNSEEEKMYDHYNRFPSVITYVLRRR